MATFDNGYLLVRTKPPSRATTTKPSESAKVLLLAAARALRKPGLRRNAVFTGSNRIYAYSVDPADPGTLVREAADGTRTRGHMVNGRFVPVKAPRG